MTGESKLAEKVSTRYVDVGLFLPAFPRFKLLHNYFWDVKTEILIGSSKLHFSSSYFVILRI